ncbi:MAG: PfkB family carbohydrate kinase [Planctomycetota bacterium]|jgi:ribokinase
MAGSTPKVVVIGGAYVDVVLKCSLIPQAGQTAVGTGYSYLAAGSGPNQAAQAANCGCQVHLLSKIGSDPFSRVVRQNLEQFNINTDFLYTAEAMNTGIIVTQVNSQGENASLAYSGANLALSPDDIKTAEQTISDADVCLVNGELPQETVIAAIQCAVLHGTKVILSPAAGPFSSGKPITDSDQIPQEYFNANIMILNLSEASDIVEQSNAIPARSQEAKMTGSDLIARGAGSAVITMGKRGCMVIDRDGADHIPAFEVELVDQSGRGDAFAGALAAYCAVEANIRGAAKFAAAAGALACTTFGLTEAMPTKAEIIELLQREEIV